MSTSFKEYLGSINKVDYGNVDCDRYIELTENQDRLARCMHWIRSNKWGLEYCKKNQFYPGPWGYLVRKKWVPHYPECCNVRIDQMVNDKYEVYAHRNHCKTYAHCRHLAYYHHDEIVIRIKPLRLFEIDRALSTPLREIPLILHKAKGYELMIYKSRIEGIYEVPEQRVVKAGINAES